MRGTGPSKFTASELASVGVEIVTESHPWLRCVECGRDWAPDFAPDGTLPSEYWHCPNGCNNTKKK